MSSAAQGGKKGFARAEALPSADDGGLGVVRIKPLGVGASDKGASPNAKAVEFSSQPAELTVNGRRFTYPSHVIAPDTDNQGLYDQFMPHRVDAFLNGVNVNIMAYGQTGSGKTYTMFGPPGIMARASAGEFGDQVCPDYGLFPRGLMAIFSAVDQMRQAGARAVLTASAVELSIVGNRDMLATQQVQQERKDKKMWDSSQLGVALDRAATPPRLYGMTELTLEGHQHLREVFAGLATRNTAATLMNDDSSRSHCLAYLTLRVLDRAANTVRMSRFQFCDLAGCERLKEAHGSGNPYTEGGEALNGMMTNFSLMMLSTCARQLVEARRAGKMKTFSFRTYLMDLVQLLQESMVGSAATACFVCLSQAPDNLQQSKHALDFGAVFAKLSTKPKAQPAQSRKKLEKAARTLLEEAERVLANQNSKSNFRMMRVAQKRDCEQLLAILERLA
jgi:hypothetical protein